MFKKMKLGTKIASGFGLLVVMAVLLGSLAVWRMHEVEDKSTMLANEYVPEVKVANNVERGSLRTMFEMRGYGLSEEESYLTRGRKHLGEVKQSLEQAGELADRSPHLVKLKSEVGEIQAQVAEYEKLVDETVTLNHAIKEDRSSLDQAAAEYMQNCTEFLDHQNEMMKQELGGESTNAGHAAADDTHAHAPAARVHQVRSAPVSALPCPAADQVVSQLQEGNQRFVGGQLAHPNLDQPRREETTSHGQKPQVTVLACSDSRVPVEAIFDQGIGDVFPVRVAGNVVSVDELGSIEYGVDHLETPLMLVLGHTHCGAVTAAATGASAHGSIPALLGHIQPVVAKIKSTHNGLSGDALVHTCVEENVWHSIEQILTRSRSVQSRAKSGQVKVMGAIYDINAGTIQWLGTHPRQGELLATVVQDTDHAQTLVASPTAVDHSGSLERLEKITLINDIIGIGNETRVACFKSQALRDPKLIEDANKNFEVMNTRFASLRKITRLKEDLDRIDKTEQAAQNYKTAMNDLLANWTNLQETSRKRGEAAERVLEGAQATASAGLEHTDTIAGEAMTSLSTASTVMTIGLVIAVAAGCALAFFITRSITKPINRIIGGLNEGADQVNDAAGQVSSASQQLAEGASEQASSLEETSSALEEMAAMTRNNASNAKQANELAAQARTAADAGDQTMGRLNSAMMAINESSEKISKIIKVIEEIAFQTNLLALNAAVEAARAGEHGKGFAVVADEVRNLAQRAAEAARETTGLIEDSVVKAREGTEVAGEVGKSLGGIVGDVAKVTDLINGIARASEEQAQGVEQVNTAVSQMDKVTQQNASGAEESASAAEELSAQAEAVKSMVAELVALVGGAGSRESGGQSSTSKSVRSNGAKRASSHKRSPAHVLTVGSHSGSKGSGSWAGVQGGHDPLPMDDEETAKLEEF